MDGAFVVPAPSPVPRKQAVGQVSDQPSAEGYSEGDEKTDIPRTIHGTPP